MEHICPSSDISYAGRCPVETCPFNMQEEPAEDNCLARQGDVAGYLSKLFDWPLKTAKREIETQTQRLVSIAEAVNQVSEMDETQSCPSCGYLRPCTSQTVCSNRLEAVKAIKQDIGDPLTHAKIWRLLTLSDVRFARRKLDANARTLLASRDVTSGGK